MPIKKKKKSVQLISSKYTEAKHAGIKLLWEHFPRCSYGTSWINCQHQQAGYQDNPHTILAAQRW